MMQRTITSVSSALSLPPAHFVCLYYGLLTCASTSTTPQPLHIHVELGLRNARTVTSYDIRALVAPTAKGDNRENSHVSVDIRDEGKTDFLAVISAHGQSAPTIGLSAARPNVVIIPTDAETHTAFRVYVNSNLFIKQIRIEHSKCVSVTLPASVQVPNIDCSIQSQRFPPAPMEVAVLATLKEEEEDDDDDSADMDEEYIDTLETKQQQQRKPKKEYKHRKASRNPLLRDVVVRGHSVVLATQDGYKKLYGCCLRFKKADTRRGQIHTAHVLVQYKPSPSDEEEETENEPRKLDCFVVLHRVKTMSNPYYRDHFDKAFVVVFESAEHAIRIVMVNRDLHLWVRHDAAQCVLGVCDKNALKKTKIEVWGRPGVRVQKIDCSIPSNNQHFDAVFENIEVDPSVDSAGF
jgi:hypothetical protein